MGSSKLGGTSNPGGSSIAGGGRVYGDLRSFTIIIRHVIQRERSLPFVYEGRNSRPEHLDSTNNDEVIQMIQKIYLYILTWRRWIFFGCNRTTGPRICHLISEVLSCYVQRLCRDCLTMHCEFPKATVLAANQRKKSPWGMRLIAFRHEIELC